MNELQAASSIVPNLEKGKYLSYKGIYLFVTEETNNRVQFLKEGLLSLKNGNGAEKRILRYLLFIFSPLTISPVQLPSMTKQSINVVQ